MRASGGRAAAGWRIQPVSIGKESRVEGRVLPEKAFEPGPQGEEGLELKNREMGAVG